MKSILLFLCMLICATVASLEGQQRSAMTTQAQPIDPCKLLTGEDIKSVQGDTLEETEPGTEPSVHGLEQALCLYRTSTPVKSVSIAVASGARKQLREYWRKQFHRGAERQEEAQPDAGKNKSGREDHEESTPRIVNGVGEEAYWVGNRMIGVLYVLRGNTFLRVSVGGVRDEAARMEKSVALARAALKRLR